MSAETEKHAELTSDMGGVHSMAGTEATLSQTGNLNGKRKASDRADDIGSQPENNLWIDATQPSQAGVPMSRKVDKFQYASVVVLNEYPALAKDLHSTSYAPFDC